MIVLLANIVRSNVIGIHTDETPLRASSVRKRNMTPKEKMKADKKELREEIRREKLENIYNGENIGTGSEL